MTPLRILLSTAAAALLAGCVVGPTYRQSPPAVPPGFAGVEAPASATPLSRPAPRDADIAAWWAKFADRELDHLVSRALAGNLDRQTAASRIRQARQEAAAARAGMFPTINGDASATHTHISQNSGFSSISKLLGGGSRGGSGSPPAPGSAGFPGLEFSTYEVGFDAAWEIDLFGGQRRRIEAARARTEAQVWSARDTDVSLTAQVAQTYLMLRSDQARLAVIRRSVASQSDLLNLIGARSRGGLVSDVDTVQQRAQLATAQAEIPPLEASIETEAHALSTLLGEAPGVLASELAPRPDPLAALPNPPPEVPVGLPSILLQRRPDIREAERNLAASTADVGAATAALYPKVELTGSFDFVSTALKSLLDAASRNYSYGASLTAPLFDAGKLRAQKHESEEQAIQAGLAYRRTVLQALKEVADALSRYAADQRRFVALQAGLKDAEQAVALDRVQYQGGLADLQATLRAQDTALQTEDQLAQTKAQLSTDLVALYKALGGGWS